MKVTNGKDVQLIILMGGRFDVWGLSVLWRLDKDAKGCNPTVLALKSQIPVHSQCFAIPDNKQYVRVLT